jgi:hypothetical protein
LKKVLLCLGYRSDANISFLGMANAGIVKRESGKLLGCKERQIALNLCNFVRVDAQKNKSCYE